MTTSNLSIWILLFAIPMMMLLNSCQKEAGDEVYPLQEKAEEAYEYPGLEAIESPALVEATEETEFAVADDGMPADLGDVETMDFDALLFAHHRGLRCNRRALLDSLALTNAQKGMIRKAVSIHHHCLRGAFAKVRAHNIQVVHRGNLARRDLLQQLRSGQITRAEFKRQLSALNKSIRNALINSPDRKRVMQSLRDCHKDYLRALHRILDPAQWQTWVAWHRACHR